MREAEFKWASSAGGYQVREGYLFPVREEGSAPQFRYYRPIEERPDLFRRFGKLEVTPEAVTSFANTFGPLHSLSPTAGLLRPDPSLPRPPVGEHVNFGEPLLLWAEEILHMRQAVDLWDMICGHRSGIEQRIRWSSDGRSVEYVEDAEALSAMAAWGLSPLFGTIAAPPWADASVLFPSRSDFEKPARARLAHLLDAKLADRRIRVTVQTYMDGDDWRLVQGLVPVNLLGALWYQLLREVTNGHGRRTCEACGKLLPPDSRPNKRTCDAKCRQALAYRGRKARKT